MAPEVGMGIELGARASYDAWHVRSDRPINCVEGSYLSLLLPKEEDGKGNGETLDRKSQVIVNRTSLAGGFPFNPTLPLCPRLSLSSELHGRVRLLLPLNADSGSNVP